jgi:hypothetical protein
MFVNFLLHEDLQKSHGIDLLQIVDEAMNQVDGPAVGL